MRDEDKIHPTQVSPHIGWFDRFATRSESVVSRAWFFAFCMMLIVVWAPTLVFLTLDMWQLLINTATTIITFLLVALLQNTQSRATTALQQKLNAIAEALIDVLQEFDKTEEDVAELRAAIGLEKRVGTT